jgi:hypothetical protein
VGTVLLATLALAGCGGDDGGTAAFGATTAAGGGATSSTVASGATSSTVAGGATTAKAGTTTVKAGATTGVGFCGDWFGAAAEVGAVSSATGNAKTDAAADLKNLENYFAALAKVAPADIKADFTTYADFWKKYAAALAKYNGDFTKLLTDPDGQKLFTELSSAKLETASSNISAWVEKNCGAAASK